MLILPKRGKAVPPRLTVKMEDGVGNNLLDNAQTSSSTWVVYEDPQNWQVSGGGYENIAEIVDGADGPVLNFESFSLKSDFTYYMKIDSTDLDTFNIIYDVKGTGCNLKTKVDQITYNGRVFAGGKKNETVTVIKY